MHLREQPEIVRERALDRAAASIREALSVHLASGRNIDYAEDDREILTTIGFRPDRASRDDNRAKYMPEQSQIFMYRQAAQIRKKSAPKILVFLRKIAMHAYAAWLCMRNPEFSTPHRTSTGAA